MRVRERFIEKEEEEKLTNVSFALTPTDIFLFFPPICHKMRQSFCRFLPKVNDCTEQKTLSIHLELIQ